MNSEALALKMAEVLDQKKAQDIRALDTREITTVTDFFLLASANSHSQVRALAEEVDEKIKEFCGRVPLHREGYSTADWILLDYGDVVVHLFYHESRTFYHLEHLWADAKSLDLSTIIGG